MKKLITSIIALTMIISLIGCSSKEESISESSPTTEQHGASIADKVANANDFAEKIAQYSTIIATDIEVRSDGAKSFRGVYTLDYTEKLTGGDYSDVLDTELKNNIEIPDDCELTIAFDDLTCIEYVVYADGKDRENMGAYPDIVTVEEIENGNTYSSICRDRASNSGESKKENDEEASLPKVATASSVMEYLKANTANIGIFVEYDERTDTNGLLGRPNQYTSKINFAITSLEQTDENDPIGGSIEVFDCNEDAVARQEYIQALGKKMSVLTEYDHVNDYVLLRINHDIAPSDEKQYEKALDSYMDSLS